MSGLADRLIASAERLCQAVDGLSFPPPVAFVYNPLRYAGDVHEAYLLRHADSPKEVLFLGMNPGPFGMAQTGIPFGEVAAVREWLGLSGPIGRPLVEHPARPVLGWDCPRSEVSGRRLWGLFRERFGTAEKFFRTHFVHNYCPLAFLSESGANLTPETLRGPVYRELLTLCDAHLGELIRALKPNHLVGIGRFASARLAAVAPDRHLVTALHPSPANPGANGDWAGAFTRQMVAAGVWA